MYSTLPNNLTGTAIIFGNIFNVPMYLGPTISRLYAHFYHSYLLKSDKYFQVGKYACTDRFAYSEV